MKRFSTLFLLALLAVVGAGAYDFSEVETTYGNTLYYVINEDGQSVSLVQGSTPYNNALFRIPSTAKHNGKTYKVTAIGPEAFMSNHNISSVELSENLETISGSAFHDSSLSNIVNLPSTLKTIERYAFYNTALSAINQDDNLVNRLNNGLEFIGEYAFHDTRIQNIVIPNSVKTINSYAFSYCSAMTEVTLGTGIKQIKDGTFEECSSLSSINLPVGIESIGNKAFYNTALEELNFPSTLNEIGQEAFMACDGLVNVVLPNSVQVVKKGAFEACDRLETFVFSNAMTEIPAYCFTNCHSLYQVTIPEGITTIGDWAFEDCIVLSSIHLPESVVVLGEFVFGKTAFSTFTFPSKLTYIGDNMFQDCKNIINFNIPSTIKEIKPYAFRDCKYMESVSIPESVTIIGSNAFEGCHSLTEVVIPSGVTEISSFSMCSGLQKVTLPEGLKKIGRYGFSGCVSLESINFPKTLEVIGMWAFSGCAALKKITLPSTLETFSDGSFRDCPMLEEIHLNRAIPSDVWTSGYTVSGVVDAGSRCVLYVPTGSKAEYDELSETSYKNFADIVEEDVDGTVYYQLSFSSDGNGTFKVNGTNVSGTYMTEMKKDVKITIVPNANYHLATLKVDGYDRTSEVVNNVYTLKNVLQNYNVEATFEMDPVTLTIQTGNGGQVGVSVKRGETYDCAIQVESGWHVNTVLFNGSDVTSQVKNGIYTTPKLNNDASLIVSFEQNSGATQLKAVSDDDVMKAFATQEGCLHVTGVEVGEILKVVSSDGKLVATLVADGRPLQFNLPAHGVYIVHSARKNIKLSY